MAVERTKVLFVCTGNICRSPSAEGVFRDAVAKAGLTDYFGWDSCGLARYHIGEAPTPTAQKAASARGYDLADLRARAFDPHTDFRRFDYILAMDQGHYTRLLDLAGRASGAKNKVHMFLSPCADMRAQTDVPDPYYGGAEDYEFSLNLIEAGCRAWLKRLTPPTLL